MMPAEPVVIRIRVLPDGRIDRSEEGDPDVVVQPGDRVTWICPDADFKVYEVKRDCDHGALCKQHGETPFETPLAEPADYVPAGGSITSPPIARAARGHLFKGTWATRATVEGNVVTDVLDPHIIVK
jgi:hypothetical protein